MTGVEQQNEILSAALDRQQRMFQQSPSFLAVLRGPDHVFEFANDAYVRLTGNRPCIGRRVAEVLPEAEPQGFLRILDTVYRTGRTYRGEDQRFELVDPETGAAHPLVVTFRYKALRDLDGEVNGIYAEGTDVSERAEDAAALEFIRQETQRRWIEMESIYENAPVGLALLGAERFEYRRLNRVQAEIIGMLPEEILGKTAREITPQAADQLEELLGHVARGGIVRDVEITTELPQRPGVRRDFLVSYAPIRLGDGTIDAIICTGLETTELRQAERVALQNEKLAAVGRLAGSIAHEINNPLEAVTNLLYLARQGNTLAQTHEYLDAADLELRRVAAITSQTLRFYRQTTEARAVACDDLLGGALGIYQSRLNNLGVQVVKRKRAHRPVLCFDGEVRQVLNNLVGNALDAMTSGGGMLTLRSREGMDWRSGQYGLWLTIADTGTGMSPETLLRLFEPFFSTKGINGTGLGLWISCEIIKRHRGQLRFRSSQHPRWHGTVAAVFLPYNAVRR